ncbi:hypothetical protein [Roseivirga misakiensis]|uniref:GyrI-like small molecule binding domain-containing protein n=1 Tax=Roseivirga misakiensis TaxID=1563681 RepID=A0A1E5T4M0_9BACT|nr:hypothetical protein [Roseivirga misakiensis]OEK06329.1 hypothetical protein BFP71_01235 [Roseivirga misakiensis]
MSKKLVTILGVTTIAIITAVYLYLGGLNSVEYSLENISDYNLVGIPFEGKAKDKAIEEAYFEAKAYIENGTISGTLALVHYNDTTLEKDEQKLFIGIKLNGGTSKVPENYERITIPARMAMRATIEAHNSVMPSPHKIEETLYQKAEELNLKLQDFTVEQYVSANLLIIDMIAK